MSPNLEQQRLLEFALENLEFGDFQQRWEAAKTLSRLNPVAIQPLIQRLANPEMDSEVRWFIARILGNFDTDGVVAALVQVLRTSGTESQNPAAEGRGENFIDEDGDEAAVQQMAAVALASLGQRAIPSLVTLMFSQQLRPLVAQALSQIQQPEVIDPLIELTQDTDPAVRVIAIEALGNFQDQRIPSLLLSALNDPTSKVRKQAVVGLGVRPQLEGTLNLS
ncbi:MAG: HEAT repeat domain-containing protein [Microcoleaceae cyanobacterium]